MTVAINMNEVSASIAVYRFQAAIVDGLSDGKICGRRDEVISFPMFTGVEDDRVGVKPVLPDRRGPLLQIRKRLKARTNTLRAPCARRGQATSVLQARDGADTSPAA
jgi:hypothetical protein